MPTPGIRSASHAYLGGSDVFDPSVTDFAERYADQSEQDYQESVDAVRSGRLETTDSV